MSTMLVEANEDAVKQAARYLAATLEPATFTFLFSLLLRPVPEPTEPKQAAKSKAA